MDRITVTGLNNEYESVSLDWKNSCTATECSLHQLSPYIGKTKSVIARDLILKYSNPKDLIIDPFSGSGTIPFEAVLLNRQAFACDANPYASVLTRAKLFAPPTQEEAKEQAVLLLSEMEKLPEPDLRKEPMWVRKFFHPRTLKEIIKAFNVCITSKNDFLLSCILGILHHQRPGFLSYPSSHLVPYLRDKKYPKDQFPDLYEYRSLQSRLLAKIERAYRNCETTYNNASAIYKHGTIEDVEFPQSFQCLITSPPYMNALDYNRDNRLRLWFLTRKDEHHNDSKLTGTKSAFKLSITHLAKIIEKSLISKGYSIFIVGEQLRSSPGNHPSEIVKEIISEYAPSLHLLSVIADDIPDVRRSRRNYKCIKTEHILIFQRT